MPTDTNLEREEIESDDFLLRRVFYLDTKYVDSKGELTSYAFYQRPSDKDGLSVDLERISDYNISIQDPSIFNLYKLKAQVCFDNDLQCLHSPEENNYAHSLIIGKNSKGIRRKLAKSSSLYNPK